MESGFSSSRFLLKFLFLAVYYHFLCKCEDINPDLKPLLDKLNLDKKYHGLANDIYNKADKTLTQDKDPLKHIQGLNRSVRMLLSSVPGPDKLVGTQVESMGKKVLQFAKGEFAKHEIAESSLRSKYKMTDEEIAEFKRLYDDTKACVDQLNILFDCV